MSDDWIECPEPYQIPEPQPLYGWPDPSQIPEPQVTCALHAVWVPDTTVKPSQSQCVTSGTVANPLFHFYAGWKDGSPAFFTVDWILIEELTNEHEPQFWYFKNPQGSSGFPYGCTMPPVSDPKNWNWTTWNLAGAMTRFAMHNSPYRITVQWRYWVYMKGPRGPFQTYIKVNVENLVIERATFGQIAAFDSKGESKVKSLSLPDYFIWDGKQAIPPINFWLRCASKGKGARMTFYIFRSDQSGPIRTVTMTNLEFGPSPPSKPYTFVWDGKNDAKKISLQAFISIM